MNVQVSHLTNGMTVATHAMPHLESAALGVWVSAGARSESANQHGISHLLEHMAFKGTRTRTARQIAEAIEAVGGEVNAATSVDHTTYYVRLLKDDVGLGIDVVSDILSNSTFDQEELHREQHVILQEIGAAFDMPEDHVFDLFQQAAYPNQPIGRPILGTADSVRGFSANDLRGFLKTHYRGPQTLLVASGHVDHDEILRFAEAHFGGFPNGGGPAPDEARYVGGQSMESRSLHEAQILLGFEAPPLGGGASYTARVLAAILGDGMASRLFQEVREARGLCYSIYSFYWPFQDTGVFGVNAATSEEDIGALMPVLTTELRKMSDQIHEAELARAKTQLRAGMLMALESPVARAGQIARQLMIYGRPLETEEIVEAVEAVQASDVKMLAAEMFSSPATLAAVGPIAPLQDLADLQVSLSGSV